jgi:hypothetical protein
MLLLPSQITPTADNVRQALLDKYGAPGTKKAPGLTYGISSHVWAAFALATYYTENNYARAQ